MTSRDVAWTLTSHLIQITAVHTHTHTHSSHVMHFHRVTVYNESNRSVQMLLLLSYTVPTLHTLYVLC